MPAFPSATTVLDSFLFRDAFGTPAMRLASSSARRMASAAVAPMMSDSSNCPLSQPLILTVAL